MVHAAVVNKAQTQVGSDVQNRALNHVVCHRAPSHQGDQPPFQREPQLLNRIPPRVVVRQKKHVNTVRKKNGREPSDLVHRSIVQAHCPDPAPLQLKSRLVKIVQNPQQISAAIKAAVHKVACLVHEPKKSEFYQSEIRRSVENRPLR